MCEEDEAQWRREVEERCRAEAEQERQKEAARATLMQEVHETRQRQLEEKREKQREARKEVEMERRRLEEENDRLRREEEQAAIENVRKALERKLELESQIRQRTQLRVAEEQRRTRHFEAYERTYLHLCVISPFYRSPRRRSVPTVSALSVCSRQTTFPCGTDERK